MVAAQNFFKQEVSDRRSSEVTGSDENFCTQGLWRPAPFAMPSRFSGPEHLPKTSADCRRGVHIRFPGI